jgi:multiple sugar transport system ATP-binding protein
LEANVEKGYLMFGKTKFMKFDIPDGSYVIGMRPEHFKVAEKDTEDKVKVDIKEIFHIGRDTMIHFELNGQNIRALVDSDSVGDNDKTVELTLKRKRVYIFDKDTGKVIDHD